MKIKIVAFMLVAALMMPMVVAAQSNPCTAGAETIGPCVSQIYLWSLGLSGLLALVMTVFGGYLVMTARGNGQQATKGKSYIYSSLMGMVLLMGAYLLLNTINTDLTEFTTTEFQDQTATPSVTPSATPTTTPTSTPPLE